MKEIATAGDAVDQHLEFLRTNLRRYRVANWKPVEKDTLLGFLSIILPSGLVINNCSLHRKGAERWIGLPARLYNRGDGTTAYAPVIDFIGSRHRRHFQAAALDAVDRFLTVSNE